MIRLIESSLLSPISSLLGPYPLLRQSVIIIINLGASLQQSNDQIYNFVALLRCLCRTNET